MTEIVETKALLNIYREYILCTHTKTNIEREYVLCSKKGSNIEEDKYVLHIVRDPKKGKIYGMDNILAFLKSKLSNSRYLKVEKYFMEIKT